MGLSKISASALTSSKTNAQSGEGSGARDHGECADGGLHEAVAGEQRRDLGNKLCRESAADQRRNLNHLEVALGSWFPGSRQSNAALLAGGIDSEKKHKESEYCSIREDPWKSVAVFAANPQPIPEARPRCSKDE